MKLKTLHGYDIHDESGLLELIAALVQFLKSTQVEAPSGRLTGMLEVATKMPSWVALYKHFLEAIAPQMEES